MMARTQSFLTVPLFLSPLPSTITPIECCFDTTPRLGNCSFGGEGFRNPKEGESKMCLKKESLFVPRCRQEKILSTVGLRR